MSSLVIDFPSQLVVPLPTADFVQGMVAAYLMLGYAYNFYVLTKDEGGINTNVFVLSLMFVLAWPVLVVAIENTVEDLEQKVEKLESGSDDS